MTTVLWILVIAALLLGIIALYWAVNARRIATRAMKLAIKQGFSAPSTSCSNESSRRVVVIYNPMKIGNLDDFRNTVIQRAQATGYDEPIFLKTDQESLGLVKPKRQSGKKQVWLFLLVATVPCGLLRLVWRKAGFL